jgi:hypothetical protein
MTDERILQSAIQLLQTKLNHIKLLAISEQEERARQAEHPILPWRTAPKPDTPA